MTKTLTPDKSGNVQLPKEVMERLDCKPGLKMRIVDLPDGNFKIEIGYDPLDWHGIIKDRGVRLTVEEINEAIKDKGNHI